MMPATAVHAGSDEAATPEATAGTADDALLNAIALPKPRLLYPLAEAFHLLGVGETAGREALKSLCIRTVRIGGRVLIPGVELHRVVCELLAKPDHPPKNSEMAREKAARSVLVRRQRGGRSASPATAPS